MEEKEPRWPGILACVLLVGVTLCFAIGPALLILLEVEMLMLGP